MAHSSEKSAESRARILASAGRGFRRLGYGSLGVDGLARSAGVTSGAFYAHFKSKAQAFREAVVAGMEELAGGIARLRRLGGDWPAAFVDFYLTDKRLCDLGDACALQSLTGEIERADADTRADYAEGLQRSIDALRSGLPGEQDEAERGQAIALLALLSGGVSMARAVNDPDLADEIIRSVRAAAARIGPAA